MQHAALVLLKHRLGYQSNDPDQIVAAFHAEFYDTQLFFDPFAGGKFAGYFFEAHERRARAYNTETAHQLIEEAQLFIDAAHSCYTRMAAQPALVS